MTDTTERVIKLLNRVHKVLGCYELQVIPEEDYDGDEVVLIQLIGEKGISPLGKYGWRSSHWDSINYKKHLFKILGCTDKPNRPIELDASGIAAIGFITKEIIEYSTNIEFIEGMDDEQFELWRRLQ